jgi:hypothetical protein
VDLSIVDAPFNPEVFYSGSKNQWELPERLNEYENWVREKGSPRLIKFLEYLKEHNPKVYAYHLIQAIELLATYRLLSMEGSLILHCDPILTLAASIEIGKGIFGEACFQKNITWARGSQHSDAKGLARDHECLLHFTKHPKDYILNQPRIPLKNDQRFSLDDNDGKGPYRLESVLASRSLSGGGYSQELDGHRFNLKMPPAKVSELRAAGEFLITSKGVPKRKKYQSEAAEDKPLTDVWTDISILGMPKSERMPFRTQKPEKLYQRLLEMHSNPGSLVLDSNGGSGTTAVVAEKLGRYSITIEKDVTSFQMSLDRLQKTDPGCKQRITIRVIPDDLEAAIYLRKLDTVGYGAGQIPATRQYEQWRTQTCAEKYSRWIPSSKPFDGHVSFVDNRGCCKSIVLEAKSQTLTPGEFRNARQKAERDRRVGVIFLVPEDVSKTIRNEALQLEPYIYRDNQGNQLEIPAVQIITDEQYFQGIRPILPPCLLKDGMFLSTPIFQSPACTQAPDDEDSSFKLLFASA